MFVGKNSRYKIRAVHVQHSINSRSQLTSSFTFFFSIAKTYTCVPYGKKKGFNNLTYILNFSSFPCENDSVNVGKSKKTCYTRWLIRLLKKELCELIRSCSPQASGTENQLLLLIFLLRVSPFNYISRLFLSTRKFSFFLFYVFT